MPILVLCCPPSFRCCRFPERFQLRPYDLGTCRDHDYVRQRPATCCLQSSSLRQGRPSVPTRCWVRFDCQPRRSRGFLECSSLLNALYSIHTKLQDSAYESNDSRLFYTHHRALFSSWHISISIISVSFSLYLHIHLLSSFFNRIAS